ncbi:MAG: hypothetical protein PHE02_02880 [Lachnospiraceae bacterium]|nr:hypothetical protein [Lachnospiraceae bacterium]
MPVFDVNLYNRPVTCSKCGGIMIFKGVGEYQCEDCKNMEYDDYGKVRNYIEKNRGATAAEIEHEIGVSQRAIRQMLRDSKIEISEGSKSFMKCEICGGDIRSGRFCSKCETTYHRQLEEEQRRQHALNIGKGFGKNTNVEATGEKRFRREEL